MGNYKEEKYIATCSRCKNTFIYEYYHLIDMDDYFIRRCPICGEEENTHSTVGTVYKGGMKEKGFCAECSQIFLCDFEYVYYEKYQYVDDIMKNSIYAKYLYCPNCRSKIYKTTRIHKDNKTGWTYNIFRHCVN